MNVLLTVVLRRAKRYTRVPILWVVVLRKYPLYVRARCSNWAVVITQEHLGLNFCFPELDAVSETDEQDLLTMTETRLLVIDAQYLGFLVSDWLSASSSEVNVLSSPVALFRRIKQNCAFLIAPQVKLNSF